MEGLDKVLNLFLSHAHDFELHGRHLAALDQICKVGSGGFAVRDLPTITAILSCTLDLALGQHTEVFLQPTCKLVRCVLHACVLAFGSLCAPSRADA